MTLTLTIIAAFIIWFSSLWVAILSLLSFVGGWNRLSRLYPLKSTDNIGHPERFSMSSMKMGFVNYRSCLNISFTETGLIIEAMKIFSIMHKPLFIPYNKISGTQSGKFFFTTYTAFTVEGKKIALYGKAGEVLLTRISLPGVSHL